MSVYFDLVIDESLNQNVGAVISIKAFLHWMNGVDAVSSKKGSSVSDILNAWVLIR